MRRFLSYGLWLGALLAGGCATKTPLSAGDRYEISAMTSQFYKYGPAQAFGPDAQLPRGEKVTLIKRSLGFSQIRLASGDSGYVATEDLRQLPPEKPTPKPKLTADRRVNTNVEPPLPQHQTTLDMSDNPAPIPFREPKLVPRRAE